MLVCKLIKHIERTETISSIPFFSFKKHLQRKQLIFLSRKHLLHSSSASTYSMDTAQWPQEIMVKPMEEIVQSEACSKPSSSLERKVRPHKDQALNCPRCNSTNTKFCYYNNYSLSQPRYFCKTCRRYWTEGGSLRNIPVGGGSRKNKRSSSSSSSSSLKKLPDLVIPPPSSQPSQNPKISHEGQDLNLGFPLVNDFKTITGLIQVPNFENTNNNKENMPTSSSTSSQLSALELLTGMTSSSSRGLSSDFMPMPVVDPNIVYSSGFSLPELKPSLNFSLDGLGNNGFGNLQSTVQEASGRLFFPFEDLKQVSTTSTATEANQQNKDSQHADSNGYWNGVLGGGATW